MKIIKSFRKTITLRVDKDGEIIVKAPFLTTNKMINAFVEKNTEWINKRKKELEGSKKVFNEEEIFYYLGEEYPILFDKDIKKMIFIGDKFVIPEKYKGDLKNTLESFYKKEAKIYILDRLEYISKINNFSFNNVRINSAKTRWGSCSSNKNLNFSFRLIMAPASVIDYVIVHELAHLKEMNHSKNFWVLVDEMCKKIGIVDYKNERKWLKINGRKISYV